MNNTNELRAAEGCAPMTGSLVECPRCYGMGWVPSNTEADTDPCPLCWGAGGINPRQIQ